MSNTTHISTHHREMAGLIPLVCQSLGRKRCHMGLFGTVLYTLLECHYIHGQTKLHVG